MPKYLELRGRTWFVTVEVPPRLQPVLGKRLKKTTGTRDQTLAEARRWTIIAELKARIEQARRGTTSAPEGLEYRKEWQAARSEDERLSILEAISVRADQIRGDPLSEELDARGQYRYDPAQAKRAGEFVGVATASLTPLEAYIEGWLRESAFQKRTMGDHRRTVARLKAWGVRTIESVDRRKAGEFVSFLMEPRPPNWTGDSKTVAKAVSALSSYWRWLERKGHVTSNPWERQAPPEAKSAAAQEVRERPFTDEEVHKLLKGTDDETLSDLIRLGALTGARLEAIARLRVSDCADGHFKFSPQKREKGHRLVPIHPDLTAIVLRRSLGKASEDYLIDEVEDVPEASQRERSMPLSKRFGRYMRACGVAVLVEGKRRSLVNFHSFRRWFITKAEQAGQPVHVIEAVVGHKRSGMSMGVYSGGPSKEQLRACVEAVKLPGSGDAPPS